MALIARRAVLTGAASVLAAPSLAQTGLGDIVLGATVPLTGPLAGSGQQYHFALQLAQDDINTAGGIGGRKLRIVFEDTQASNSVAVNAFVKLARDLDPPLIFLSSYTTQNFATEPEVAKAKMPVFYAGGADALAKRGNPYMYRIRPYDTITVTALARTVIERVKARKAGIIFVQDDFGQSSANLTEKLLGEAGIPTTAKESYGVRDNDMSAQLLSLRNKGADVIVAFTYVRDGALVIAGRRSLGIDVPMVTSGATTIPATLALLDPKDLENLYSTTDSTLDGSQDRAIAKFVESFTKRFGVRPDPFGSCYYDAAMMAAEAIRQAGTEREAVRAALSKITNYNGVTQTFWADPIGNLAHSTAVVRFRPGTKDFALVEKVTLN